MENERQREREGKSELIVLTVCLVIWFSQIFRLLSLVVVTDAVSGLTTAIFTSNTPRSPLVYQGLSLTHKQKIRVCKSLVHQIQQCVHYYEIPHSEIAPEKHTTAVPAPNKWPTLHINTHLHASKFPGSFIVAIAGSVAFHFKHGVALVQFLENAVFFLLHSLKGIT